MLPPRLANAILSTWDCAGRCVEHLRFLVLHRPPHAAVTNISYAHARLSDNCDMAIIK